MYIQEVVIDGFKSYGQKTVVSGFDPQFNAITGLNGTGKSNVLDAICFNLGITNLSQVRAGSMQDLIYKQGQAGVTKATVTVTFSNTDPSSSPVGYETYKQIIVSRSVMIGGKTKYTINGHTVQQQQVQNLFHSVQLNVNNPHFLIMQGRITKVLNMKPPEILSMIEEASGTRMYEKKKEDSLKILAKKQTKIDEIDACMKDEITPALTKLHDERVNYTTWQSNNIELEKLDRIVTACRYLEAQEKIQTNESDKAAMEAQIKTMNDSIKQRESAAATAANQIKAIEDQRSSETEGELQKLKKNEGEINKDLVKLKTQVDHLKETVSSENENLSSLNKQSEALARNIKAKEAELVEHNTAVKAKEQESAAAEAHAIKTRENYQNAFAGIASEENATVLSIPEQIATWEKKAREAQSHIQQQELHVNHDKETLKELKKTLKADKASYDSSSKEAQAIEGRIEIINQKLVSIDYNPESQSKLVSRAKELKTSITSLRDQVDRLTASVEAKLRFEYSDPERGFDRTRVKGLVARLVRVKDSRASTALEIAAGAKLYQVVVDTEQTGKLILQKGQLKRRVTILPLNKLSSRCTDESKVRAAKSIASSMGGSAHLALELVGFDEEIRKAMEHTFGNSIICDTQEVAKTIAFNEKVRNRTITFDGDTFDPSGTLTGGSKNQLGKLLAQIGDLSSFSIELNNQQAELANINRQLNKMEESESAVRDLKSQLDLAEHSLKISKDKLNSTSYAQTQRDIDALEAKLLDYQREADEYVQAIRKANDELAQLQSLEKNSKKSREAALKDMETAMKNALKTSNQVKSALTTLRSRRDTVEAELQSMNEDKSSLQEQISLSESTLRKLNDDLKSQLTKLEALAASLVKAEKALAEKQRELNESSKEIKQLTIQKEKLLQEAKEISLEARKLTHNLQNFEKEFKEAEKVVRSLIKEYPWIEKEKQYFGMKGSDYDFETRDIEKSYQRHKQLKSEQEKLSKKINKKVMGTIEKFESEYEDLRRKKEVITNDKTKIEAVIEELDVKKAQALQTAWIKVNRDFGSIFSMLLPGAQSKLETLEGCSVSEGLEVKVAFNGVWKESLTELSGGQRSLLALSLILALLLFKPAPMYILDEVDAALDLSHTQNIGLMLRTHFSQSQFIVVSLKEGMFNNANVIFRTKFVDGVSAVTRTVIGGRSKAAQIENDDENEPARKKGKDKTKSITNLEYSQDIEV